MFLRIRLFILCSSMLVVSAASAGLLGWLKCRLRLTSKPFILQEDLPFIPKRATNTHRNVIEHFSDREKWKKDAGYIDAMSREDADALFRKLLAENENFSKFVAKTVWKHEGEGREVGRHVSMLQRSILWSFNSKFPGQVITSQSIEVETLKSIVNESPEFIQWLNTKEVDTDWQKDEAAFAAKILHEWEEETRKRNTPVKAKMGQYLNPDYESRYTFAVIGEAQYVSSQDSQIWLKVGGSAKAPEQIPRWNGNRDEFKKNVEAISKKKSHPVEIAKSPSSYVEAHAQEQAPTVSVSSGMAYFKDGKLISIFENRDFVDTFIRENAFGYHVTNFDRLESILKNGWLLHQMPTNLSESSRDFGLHLSTHLGVDYPIDGKTVVLRTPLEPIVYERRDSSYYGHVRRMFPMEASEVPHQLEFSPDRGISWYPLNEDFLQYMKDGLLPVLRGTPQ